MDAETANSAFLVTVAVTLLPFLIWCFIVDVPITIAWIDFVWKGTLRLPKAAVIMSPPGFSLLTKVIYAGLMVIGFEQYAFLAGCGESWGHALMCLAFWKAYRNDRSE